jgi:hypothetical protein
MRIEWRDSQESNAIRTWFFSLAAEAAEEISRGIYPRGRVASRVDLAKNTPDLCLERGRLLAVMAGVGSPETCENSRMEAKHAQENILLFIR